MPRHKEMVGNGLKEALYRVGFEHEQINAQVKEIKDNIYTTS